MVKEKLELLRFRRPPVDQVKRGREASHEEPRVAQWSRSRDIVRVHHDRDGATLLCTRIELGSCKGFGEGERGEGGGASCVPRNTDRARFRQATGGEDVRSPILLVRQVVLLSAPPGVGWY